MTFPDPDRPIESGPRPPGDPTLPLAADANPGAGTDADPLQRGLPDGAVPEPGWPAVVAEPVRASRIRRPSVMTAAVVAIGLFVGAALFLSGYSLGARNATTPGTPAEERALFAPFWDAYHSITRSYVGEVDRAKLVQGAIKGMFDALGDPFSGYMTSDEMRAARESISGQFEGIGASIAARVADSTEECTPLSATCRMTVVAPLAGSPAEAAGLQAGDVILAVDGTSIDGLTLDAAIKRVRGPKGTPVTLSIQRTGRAQFDLRIVRDVIVESQVEVRELAGGSVGYLRVTSFSDNSAADVKKHLAEFAAKGITKVVLDLRDNGGGYVVAARAIASQFIAEGPVYWEEDASGHQDPTNVDGAGIMTDATYKVVVLVNGGSASASEIVAGALQDTGRGTLVGETTYGKGTIQAWTDLSFGDGPTATDGTGSSDGTAGAFRLTIAKWLTPNKRWIHQKGLTPDVTVAADAPAGASGDAYIEAALKVLGATASRPEALLRAA